MTKTDKNIGKNANEKEIDESSQNGQKTRKILI